MPANESMDGKIVSYKLPICDTNRERRNFEGFEKNQWYSLAELQSGDLAGTTETDSKTAPKEEGYSTVNKKSGKGGRSWKSSSARG